jgi:hypothetical protein
MDHTTLITGMAFLSCVLMVVPAGMAWDFKGEVIGVLDGDTIEVLHNRRRNVSGSMALIVPRNGSPRAGGERSEERVMG